MAILQAGAIPYQLVNGEPRYLLVTSTSGRWIFPKGLIDPGETPELTAWKETIEEAGVIGMVEERVGVWKRRKWGRDVKVGMYLLRVEREADVWLEAGLRQRIWLPYKKARAWLQDAQLRKLVGRARKQLDRVAA